jgi:hypothetical protein
MTDEIERADCEHCGKGPDQHSVVGYTVICRPPMLEPVGALQLPRWQYILRSLAAVLASEPPLAADYRKAAAQQLGEVERFIASIRKDDELRVALSNVLDLIDELYREYGVELDDDDVAIAQSARSALSSVAGGGG